MPSDSESQIQELQIGVITYDLLVTRPDALPTKLKQRITVEPI